ncbi:MAG: DUF5060 domain-containing protein [Armatimonadota bacterium]
MKRGAIWLALQVVPGLCAAQGFQVENGGFVLRRGEEYIRYAGGVWSAGVEGERSIRWHMFLWHDNWLYETLQGGNVEEGPTLHEDGSITVSGAFSTREGSPPVSYALRISPSRHGARVRCSLTKTGELKLANGVWLHVLADRETFTGRERVWGEPSWQGRLGTPGRGPVKRLRIEVQDGRAVCLTPARVRSAEHQGTRDSYVIRLNLVPSDFEVGKRAVADYRVSFEDMPDSLPGEVRPMRQQLAIRGVTPSSATIGRYERLELDVDLAATYDNPYNPDDVALDAVFTAPSGEEFTVPGFFMVEHKREVRGGHEVMTPEGNGTWKVRFTPTETGRYTWRLALRDRSGEVTGGEGAFTAKPSRRKGFLRQSTADSHYFAFDNGDGYFAIGHNLPIYHTSGQIGDEAMRKFAAARENYNRWWMSSSGFGIEWLDELGWYRQDVAARVDLVLDLAERLGLYYMMCMDTHQDFRESGWEKNPFNAKNGGPCETPADWFTSETARELYRKRLRYTVARWGYSPHVLCWEFGNEFEGWANSPNEVKLPWHREMSDYLRSIDPFGHLITTSFWGKTGPEQFWELENIDIVQTHCYTNDNGNVAEPVRQYSLHQWERFRKPHVFGEFGIRSHTTTADKDPEGWAIHNALWAGLFSFCAGGPMPWWHERYIDKLDLYFHFTALAKFAQGLPLGTAKWEMLETTAPEFVDQDRQPETRHAEITPRASWGKADHDEFVVLADGTVQDERRPLHLLHGQAHKDLKHPPTFVVDYPQAGEFVVHVDVVSSSGLLRIWVDGDLKSEVELPCGGGLGKQSVWREQWKLWETTYDTDIAVPVSAGQHRIRVENSGKDWVKVASYRFTGCKVLDTPNLLVCGMKTKGLAMLWLQNRDSSWYNHAGNSQVGKVDPCTLTLRRLADGRYRAEWWETWRGKVQRTEKLRVSDGCLTLSLPTIRTDVAIVLRRI